jgi:hypothetical protein
MRGDEALRAAWNYEGSRRRIGVNISERKSGTYWSFIHRLGGGTGTELSARQAILSDSMTE